MYNCQSYMVQVVLHTDAKTQSKEGGGGGGGGYWFLLFLGFCFLYLGFVLWLSTGLQGI